MFIDEETKSKINQAVKARDVARAQKDGLSIYCYTNRCAVNRNWNETTRLCRGLILNDETGEIVAKPFPKFFNLGEMEETQAKNLPNQPYDVFDKMDGSLGILYRHQGHRIATKLNFDSDQALWATERLRGYDLSSLADEITLLFEIIYPENRIVVNYRGYEDLVLIGGYDRSDGRELSWDRLEGIADNIGFTLCPRFDGKTLEQCVEESGVLPANKEGWVIRFADGLRVKIKGDQYKQILRIMNLATPKYLWSRMEKGRIADDFSGSLPEEIADDVKATIKALESNYDDEIRTAKAMFHKVSHIKDRKEMAQTCYADPELKPYAGAIFCLADNNNEGLDRWATKRVKP